jgi:peroxiredoxin
MWIAFFRFAACPFCALRVREVIERMDDIDASPAQFVGVFPSSKENIRKYIMKFAPRFRVVSDPEEKLYGKYKAEASWAAEFRTAVNIPKVVKALVGAPNNPFAADATFNRVPCEFLIHQGSIEHAYYGKTLDDGEDIDAMLHRVSALA